jgi:rhamnosyltransferase
VQRLANGGVAVTAGMVHFAIWLGQGNYMRTLDQRAHDQNGPIAEAGEVDKHICAIVVTYQPHLPMLQELIQLIRRQVSAVVVVDNTCGHGRKSILAVIGDSAYLPMDSNKGVGRAFNVGVDWAREQGCDHVLLLDQDSLPCEMMIPRLIAAEEKLLADGYKVAAVGPDFRDPKYRVIRPFSRVQKWRVRRYQCGADDSQRFIKSDFLISSGTLLRISVLDVLGNFEESLFIDYVDIEWCLRAKNRGFNSYGVCGAVLEHSLGENVISFWFVRNWSVPIHAAVRNYYLYRNAISLCRRPYISLVWKLRELRILVLKAIFVSIMLAPRSEHLRMIFRGVYDGFRNRSGPFRTGQADKPRNAKCEQRVPIRPGSR